MFFLRSGPGLRTPFASFNTRGFKLDAPAVRRYTDGMALNIREFSMSDYDAAYALWKRTEGIGLSQADKAPNVARFLARNPGLSFVAEEKGRIVGAVMCGNDGRRGFLHHLAVEKARRKTGIGKSLVERCLSALAAAGLRKCHIFVIADNIEGQRFWRKIGWEERTTLKVMSRDV
ncbi:MAG: GNAT family N-acetyltransferase [Spirochaetia bacterium]|jgi:ribosomal protein S18 acetylase RimI-like enzyme